MTCTPRTGYLMSSMSVAVLTALVLPLSSSDALAVTWPWQKQLPVATRDLQAQSPQVLNVSYIPAEMRLAIRVDRPNEVSIYSPMRQAHQYQFFVNNAHIVGNSTNIPVQGGDAFVKSIRLEQRSLSNLPAVLVTMDLLPNASTMQFDVQKTSADGSLSVAMRPQGFPENVAMFATSPTGNYPTNPVYRTGPSLAPQAITMPTQPYYSNWIQPQLIQPYPMQQSQQMALRPSNPYPINQAGPGPASVAWPVIKDIVSSSSKDLNIVSDNNPLAVERVFSLKTPERYVLDLTPARLDASLRNRVLEVDSASKLSVKTSQLDEDTVRVVLTFKTQASPVQLTQENQNKLIHLSY